MRMQTSVIMFVSFLSLFLISCSQNSTPATSSPKQVNAKMVVAQETPSCALPTPSIAQQCVTTENHILASTVRIEFREWHSNGNTLSYAERGTSHGTIKNGRYLITHNHFPLPLTQLQNSEEGSHIKASIYRVNGEIVLQDMPLTAFNIAFEDEQLLVFDFLSYGEQGLFAMMGLPSAQFMAWEDANLQVGSEVAQLNWDGQVARVEWVRIKSIHGQDDVPHLELDNFLQPGASGGGVFLNGVHIANNWARLTDLDNSGLVVEQYSIAALNVISVEI